MPDAITEGEVARIARLAHLALTDEEKAVFSGQLTRILDYARQIAALDTSGVSPMARVDEALGAERADEPRPSLARDEALGGAPESVAGLFTVPRAIVEDEGA